MDNLEINNRFIFGLTDAQIKKLPSSKIVQIKMYINERIIALNKVLKNSVISKSPEHMKGLFEEKGKLIAIREKCE